MYGSTYLQRTHGLLSSNLLETRGKHVRIRVAERRQNEAFMIIESLLPAALHILNRSLGLVRHLMLRSFSNARRSQGCRRDIRSFPRLSPHRSLISHLLEFFFCFFLLISILQDPHVRRRAYGRLPLVAGPSSEYNSLVELG